MNVLEMRWITVRGEDGEQQTLGTMPAGGVWVERADQTWRQIRGTKDAAPTTPGALAAFADDESGVIIARGGWEAEAEAEVWAADPWAGADAAERAWAADAERAWDAATRRAKKVTSWENLETIRSGRFLDKGRGMQMLFSRPDVKVLFTTIGGRSVTTKVATKGEAAVCYAKQGLRILPLRGARPTTTIGRPPMKVDEVRAHWRAYPEDNIGIETGHGLIAIVITGAALIALSDVARDRAWRVMVEALDRNVLGVTSCDLEICKMQAITGRSMQLLFAVRTSKNITSGTISPGFEVRSAGGFIIVPPLVAS